MDEKRDYTIILDFYDFYDDDDDDDDDDDKDDVTNKRLIDENVTAEWLVKTFLTSQHHF